MQFAQKNRSNITSNLLHYWLITCKMVKTRTVLDVITSFVAITRVLKIFWVKCLEYMLVSWGHSGGMEGTICTPATAFNDPSSGLQHIGSVLNVRVQQGSLLKKSLVAYFCRGIITAAHCTLLFKIKFNCLENKPL